VLHNYLPSSSKVSDRSNIAAITRAARKRGRKKEEKEKEKEKEH
jgi:hypothetical protein